jgi:hypothetical protein
MWAIMSKDSTDTFVEEFEDYDLYAVDFFPSKELAEEKYKQIKRKISNVFLVEVIKSEVNI